jgi:hypothetical protein
MVQALIYKTIQSEQYQILHSKLSLSENIAFLPTPTMMTIVLWEIYLSFLGRKTGMVELELRRIQSDDLVAVDAAV